MDTPARPYKMTARAVSAAATRERILAGTRELLLQHSFDDMTIEDIAHRAGTTVRTVLRLFSSKEDLFAAALHSLGEYGQAPIIKGNTRALIAGTYDFYEKVGDTVIRWLADEPKLPALRAHLEIGRQHLRAWVAEAFAAPLRKRSDTTRRRVHDGLVVAFDVYTWKLLRRDFALERKEAEQVVLQIVQGLIREDGHGPDALVELVGRRKSAAKPRHLARPG